jgi:hypothetical protein
MVYASTALSKMSGISVRSVLSHGIFNWSSVSGASGYDVFVINSKGKYIKKDTTYNNYYITGKLKTGKTYKYAFRAFKEVGGDKTYSKTRRASVKPNPTAYGRKPSGTWVEVCTETQTLMMYVNNKLYVSTPVVTGNYGSLDTTPGYHSVISRQSPTILRGSSGGYSWETYVDYWLGFTSDGQGIHDASWRSAFGGNIYMGDGSHGCVNTPTAAIRKMFGKAYVGMPVIVF